MGRLFDEFGQLAFQNEAAVSQNFILPLLENYLGYRPEEIIPEVHYPARDIFSGVNFAGGGTKGLSHRPDYVVCLDGNADLPRFIIDSKGPQESIDSHLGQLRSYAISVGRNLLMMTNGKELQVYNVNDLLFRSVDIADLQDRIGELIAILGRSNQQVKSTLEILKDVDLDKAISTTDQQRMDKEMQRRRVLLSDFRSYLEKISVDFVNWHLPSEHFQALNDLRLTGINPGRLLIFQLHDGEERNDGREKQFKLHNLKNEAGLKIKVFVGETGTGKTCLLKFMTLASAGGCLNWRQLRIPVFIALREVSQRQKLGDLITDSLNRNGYRLTSLYDLPENNEFVFYLDAYDEIPEHLQDDTYREISYLGERYECYITTRPNVIPHFKPSMIFDLLPISAEDIKQIVKSHIGDRYYEFLHQLENGNMARESGNILLLLCLISVYRELGALPRTAPRVIAAIADRVRKWQDSKHGKVATLSWEAISQFLARIAFHLVECGTIALPRRVAEQLLLEPLIALEHQRKIPLGYTIAQVINELERTGLIMGNSDSLYFWHRLFLNHFASMGLRSQFILGLGLIEEKVREERWHVVIVGMASLLSDVTELVRNCKDNLWLSAYCLEENNQCEPEVLKAVVDQLMTLVTSAVPEMRNRASHTITRIESEYVLGCLYEAVERDISSELKMHALSTIGRTREGKALSFILQHLEWVEGSFFSGTSSQAHVARGLYYFDEPEHLLIIERWSNTNDYLLDKECGSIFLELHTQGRLTTALLRNLEDLFIDSFVKSEGVNSKLYPLGTVLSLNPDNSFANRLLDIVSTVNFPLSCAPLNDLLKHYSSLPVIEKLKCVMFEHAKQKHDSFYLLMPIVCESEFGVPKEIYLELAEHSDKNVAYQAVAALSRFPFQEVKEAIYRYLYGDDPQMQNGALQALVKNGEIIELIRSRQFPSPFYTPTAHTLLGAIRRYNLYEALPILESIFSNMGKDRVFVPEFNLALDLACTFYFLGEKDKQMSVINWYFDGKIFTIRNEYLHFHLMKRLKYLTPELTIPVAVCYFNTYAPLGKEQGGIKMNTFLEVVEELGNYEFVPYIKRIIEGFLSDRAHLKNTAGYHLERPMRTLVALAQPEDEDWVLRQLDDFKQYDGFYFPQLGRALECLARVGSIKSLPYIKQIAAQLKHNETVINACQIAYEHICFRLKMPLTGDLFSDMQ